jgi:hypothetical protein
LQPINWKCIKKLTILFAAYLRQTNNLISGNISELITFIEVKEIELENFYAYESIDTWNYDNLICDYR